MKSELFDWRKTIVATMVISAIITFGLVGAPATARAGEAYQTMINHFCTQSDFHEKTGCHGYWQYRIKYGQSRDKAKTNCPWGCGQVFSGDNAKIAKCRTGCAWMHERDN